MTVIASLAFSTTWRYFSSERDSASTASCQRDSSSARETMLATAEAKSISSSLHLRAAPKCTWQITPTTLP